MNIVQTFFKDYFDAKSWLHHHSIVSGMAAVSAFVVISSSLFGLSYSGTYAADGSDMSISNNSNTEYVDVGDTIAFIYFYQNEDYPSKLATNITLQSNVPDGMTYISANPSPDVVGNTLQWDNLPDDNGIIVVEMQVDDIASLVWWSTAWISADGEDPYMNNNHATANIAPSESLTSANNTDLRISNTASHSIVQAGQIIEYTLSYQNISDTTAENAIIVNTLPDGAIYISSDIQPSNIDNNSIAWSLENIAPGDGWSISIWASVSTLLDDGFNMLNFASIDSNNYDDDNSNNIAAVSSEVLNDGADLYVNTSSSKNTVDPNKDFQLDILAGNRWPNSADNIQTTLTLPAGMTIASASPNYTSSAGKSYTWSLDGLDLWGMSTITLTLRSSVSGVYDIVAAITSDTNEISNNDNGSIFALAIGSTSTNAWAAAGGGWSEGAGESWWASLSDIIQSVKSEITNEHPAATTTVVSPGNAADAWAAFKPNTQAVQSIANKVDANKYPTEMIEAFLFAKNVGMTSFSDITKAMMYNELTRAQLAKFAVEYATDVLGVEADMDRSTMCFWYTDTTKAGDLLQYIQYSCMMKLLGQKADGVSPAEKFRPNDLVTRAEFGTFMSRLVFGDIYNSKSANDPKWYQAHLEALKANGIITQIDEPFKQELRAWAMVIMYRTAEFLANK